MGRQGPKWRLVTHRIAPAILLAVTFFTSYVAGSSSSDNSFMSSALLFAVCVMMASGAHGLGHYLAARRSGVDVSFPYFVPQPVMVGTSGAFVKMSWPIQDRRALILIFAAGPVAGFVVSAVFLTVGFLLSERIPQPSGEFLTLGDSLLTLTIQSVVFPGIAENEDVLLHPVGLAGYFGLSVNLWQLFPAGRFDGGRVVYALLGYRRALFVSWTTIALLMALGTLSPVWPSIGIFAALTMIRLKRQHPVEQDTQSIDRTTIRWVLAMFAILVLTFVPVPLRPAP